MKSTRTLVATILLAWISAPAASLVQQYNVFVPGRTQNGTGGYNLVAWQFSPMAVADALDTAPDGTIMYYWSVPTQSWVSNVRDFGEWQFPNYVLQSGEAFMLRSPTTSDLNLTFSGTIPQSAYIQRIFSQYVTYALGYPYPLSADYPYLECVHDINGSFRYSITSYGYVAHIGDSILLWDYEWQDWVTETRYNPWPNYVYWWSNEGQHVSPTITLGRGFLLTPSAGNAWLAYPYGTTCQ